MCLTVQLSMYRDREFEREDEIAPDSCEEEPEPERWGFDCPQEALREEDRDARADRDRGWL